MSRGKGPLAISLCLSILLHLVALFRFYIQTVADRPFEGDGKVSLVRAVIMAPTPAAEGAPGAPGERVREESAPPPEEAQLKFEKTEPVAQAAPPAREASSETISTVPEVASALEEKTGKEPAGSAPAEVSEKPSADTGLPAGDAAGSDTLMTKLPPEPEAPPVKPVIAGVETVKEAPKKTDTVPAGTKKDEAVGESEKPVPIPLDLPEAKRFVPIYRVDKKPQVIMKAVLVYPTKAAELNIHGTVWLEADIDEKGKVGDIRVVKSVGFGLDEEAVRWVRACTFSPAYVQDKPVAVKMSIPVDFKPLK